MDPSGSSRLMALNPAPVNPRGRWVVYWMIASRRLGYNFALERAAGLARELERPLVILEPLRLDYPWASQRSHAFILQGMAQNAARLAQGPVLYHPYVEPQKGAAKGLLAAWAQDACQVVTDWFPAFFYPAMLAAAGKRLAVRLEAMDGCGLLPLEAGGREFTTAYSLRRFLQKHLPGHLAGFPRADPLAGLKLPPPPEMPKAIARRWPMAEARLLNADPGALAELALDHAVAPVELAGGEPAGRARLQEFLASGLVRFADQRNQPGSGAQSGLSPYLHFGHISAHEIFAGVAQAEGWSPARLGAKAKGKRQGWWGMSPGAEAFLDQVVTWRELGYGYCHHRPDYQDYGTLPGWALKTLAEHAGDPRPWLYGLDELEAAATHDEIWNAAQRQLRQEGTIHNYLRMLWGKKILEWSPSPQEALAVMTRLNNRWALDGRGPNSTSGIFWCLGRFDRAFGERPVFGKVRYMSSDSTRRKLKLADYLERFGPKG